MNHRTAPHSAPAPHLWIEQWIVFASAADHAVDGRNPAPPNGMLKSVTTFQNPTNDRINHLSTGDLDYFRQLYLSHRHNQCAIDKKSIQTTERILQQTLKSWVPDL